MWQCVVITVATHGLASSELNLSTCINTSRNPLFFQHLEEYFWNNFVLLGSEGESQLDMQIECDGNGGLQQPSCSDSGHILVFRKIMEQELEPMVPKIVGREAQPTVIYIEDIIRRVVREENQSLMEKNLAGGTRNDYPEDKTFRLKFLDELPDIVWTGTVLISKENEHLKMALHNSEGRVVKRGPGSSAKVDLVLLEANDNDDESKISEIFESRTIKTGEKKKPHFTKDVHIYLEEGVGILTGVKFGHGSDWVKKYKYRLGAKMGQNLNGVMVQEAWTPPFEVKDKRIKIYEKHYPPKLDSEVWRLEQIGRNGVLHKRLKGKNIETVRDFLFWFHVNPEGLKQMLHRYWKAVVTHANKTCIPDDKIYSHKSSSKPQMSVVYTAVGKLKGVIDESHFVRIDKLSTDEKDDAHMLLRSLSEQSAFEQRYDTFFNDEASLLQQFPLADPQNSGGAAPVDPGLENHCPPISLQSEEPQINAGASENEMRKMSSRPSTTNSFQENGAQDSETFISMTDIEISYDATGFQGSETSFDDGASCLLEFALTDPPPPVLGEFPGVSFEEFYFQTMLSDIPEINVGASENEIGELSRRRSTTRSFEENGTDHTEGDDGTWQQYIAHDEFHEGPEDSQHYGAYAEPHHVFSTRDGPKGWKLVKFVVCFPKWWFSITVRVPRPHHVTRKRKR